ncbi:MAG: nucleotidyltransferase domain-containing protein [Candidatus Omnitrophica bacterium]|nr:nucleotidyltransferase domain-containing protein [Candidatus Omnitrophota bacterium]
MKRTKPVVNTQIRQMVKRIVERFDPEQVILFGSHARGEAGPDSDVDLLVVMPVEGSKREKRIAIGVSLSEFGVPLDVVLSTPKELESRRRIPGTIERPAVQEGQVLYARG